MVFNYQPRSEAKVAPQAEWNIDQLTEAFKHFDRDNDGQLSADELRAAFDYLGSRWPRYRGFVARHKADKDGDGLINLKNDEFTLLVKYAHSCGYKVVDK